MTRPRPQAELILRDRRRRAAARALAARPRARWRPGPAISARAGRRRGRAGRRTRSCGRRWRARPCGGARPRTSRSAARAAGDLRAARPSTRSAPTTGSWSASTAACRSSAVSPGRPAAPPRSAAPGRDRARPLRGELPPRRRHGRAAVRGDAVAPASVPARGGGGRMTLPFAPELRPHPPAGRRRPARRRGPGPAGRDRRRARAAASSAIRASSTRPAATAARPGSRCERRFCSRPPCCSWSTSSCGASGCRDRPHCTGH